MGVRKEITSDKTTTRTKRNANKTGLLSFLSSSISRVYLFFVDIVSIIICFWTVLLLLYFSFVKDFVEILLYAAQKYINRFKWLCRIARVNKFRNCKQGEADIPKCMLDEINCLSPDEVFKGSPGIINVATCEVNSEQFLTATPQILACEAITPRRLDLNPDNYKRDIAYVSPVQHSPFKRSIFGWNFDKIRLSNSFRNQTCFSTSSSNCDKANKMEVKVRQIFPTCTEDKEKLILADESSENIGCCSSIFAFLKSKFQIKRSVSSSMHYKRF